MEIPMLMPDPRITAADLREIAHAVAGRNEVSSVLRLLKDAAVAKFQNFMSNGADYFGDVFVVVWPAGPDVVDVLTRDRRGVLVTSEDLEPGKPSDTWGEDGQISREDWHYEVGNDYTNLGYWDWVQSMRATANSR